MDSSLPEIIMVEVPTTIQQSILGIERVLPPTSGKTGMATVTSFDDYLFSVQQDEIM